MAVKSRNPRDILKQQSSLHLETTILCVSRQVDPTFQLEPSTARGTALGVGRRSKGGEDGLCEEAHAHNVDKQMADRRFVGQI